MEILNNRHKLFKNIFPDYQSFKDWYIQSPLSDDGKDFPEIKTFTLIANEYNDSHACMSEESFKEHFANDLYTYYKEFEETTKSIAELMRLSDDDISVSGSMIINTAQVPEEESSTSVEEVDFITSQQKTIQKKGILQVKKELLSSKRTFTVKTFLKRFKHLFIRIASPAYNYVIAEDIEE